MLTHSLTHSLFHVLLLALKQTLTQIVARRLAYILTHTHFGIPFLTHYATYGVVYIEPTIEDMRRHTIWHTCCHARSAVSIIHSYTYFDTYVET